MSDEIRAGGAGPDGWPDPLNPSPSPTPQDDEPPILVTPERGADELGLKMFEIIVGVKRPTGKSVAELLDLMPADDKVRVQRAGRMIHKILISAIDQAGTHRSSPSSAWTRIDGVAAAPVGQWLVMLEDGKRHVMVKHPNITIVGGHFSFDMPKVTHYAPLLEPPK